MYFFFFVVDWIAWQGISSLIMYLKFQCLFTFCIINVIYLDSTLHSFFFFCHLLSVGGYFKALTYCAHDTQIHKHVRTFYAFFEEINDEQWKFCVLTMSLPTRDNSKHALILVCRTRIEVNMHVCVCVYVCSLSRSHKLS